VNVEALEATVSGGVTVADLNAAAGRHALAAVIGNDGAISMAGLILGGGYGPLMTRFGLASDSLISAELALADGSIVSSDATHNRDLFWAVKGGGGNFGVVTSMRLRLHRVGQVLSGSIVFPWGDAPAVLERFSGLMQAAPDELAGAAILWAKASDAAAKIAYYNASSSIRSDRSRNEFRQFGQQTAELSISSVC
jgi:FAD/FMN-containing dehydrogenase